MKLTNANVIRTCITRALNNYFSERGEDVGVIASNTLNFPVVAEDGEEGWIEIVVKVPKGTKDEEYDGYGRRRQYEISLNEKAEKNAEKQLDDACQNGDIKDLIDAAENVGKVKGKFK